MWYFNDMFNYMFKTEFVALVSSKVPSGEEKAFNEMQCKW